MKLIAEQELLVGYGENHLQLHNIDVYGGTMTVNGRDIPAGHEVYFMGSKLPTDKNSKFVGPTDRSFGSAQCRSGGA